MAEKKGNDEQTYTKDKVKRISSENQRESNELNTSNKISEIIRELINKERIARQSQAEYDSTDEEVDFHTDSSTDGIDEDRVINIDKKKNIMGVSHCCTGDDMLPEQFRPREAKRRSKSKRRKGRSRSRSRRRSKRR